MVRSSCGTTIPSTHQNDSRRDAEKRHPVERSPLQGRYDSKKREIHYLEAFKINALKILEHRFLWYYQSVMINGPSWPKVRFYFGNSYAAFVCRHSKTDPKTLAVSSGNALLRLFSVFEYAAVALYFDRFTKQNFLREWTKCKDLSTKSWFIILPVLLFRLTW